MVVEVRVTVWEEVLVPLAVPLLVPEPVHVLVGETEPVEVRVWLGENEEEMVALPVGVAPVPVAGVEAVDEVDVAVGDNVDVDVAVLWELQLLLLYWCRLGLLLMNCWRNRSKAMMYLWGLTLEQ